MVKGQGASSPARERGRSHQPRDSRERKKVTNDKIIDAGDAEPRAPAPRARHASMGPSGFNGAKPLKQREEPTSVTVNENGKKSFEWPWGSRHRTPSGLVRYNINGERIRSSHHQVTGYLQWINIAKNTFAVGPQHPLPPSEYKYPDGFGQEQPAPKVEPGQMPAPLKKEDLKNSYSALRRKPGLQPAVKAGRSKSFDAASATPSSISRQSEWSLITDTSYGMTGASASSLQDAQRSSPPTHSEGTERDDELSTTFSAGTVRTPSFGVPMSKDTLELFERLCVEYNASQDPKMQRLLRTLCESGAPEEVIREDADERKELIALRAERESAHFPPPRGEGEGRARESQLKRSERSPANEDKREKSEGLSGVAKNQADSAPEPSPNRQFLTIFIFFF